MIRNKSAVDYSFLRRIIFPIFLIYVLIGAVSLLQAINLAEGIADLSKAILFLIFFIVATGMMLSNPRFIAHLSRGLVISAAILAIIGICQYFRIAFMDISSNTYLDATFFNKNLFANALLLMLPFVVYGILNFKGIWSDISIFSLLISGFIIGASHTRSSWVG
ncbi:MAG: hypothetical protein L0Y73_09355, partial [Candidatus Aminicenantes bacterium]|nr:hypothetical protein [Candidatus Aminicenantes bacterium]